ncbi:hypothetical protein GpartN1_g7352.t1 [Galdieria partita]|uniref:Uncharacterized protein n=1 Tax=Galdieria partita TaxID=83374 RepID=A0A9C7Q3K1_9RHOD|nr:hypothetical protein GpartN1_g7352.t1 [Galdieria partita]
MTNEDCRAAFGVYRRLSKVLETIANRREVHEVTAAWKDFYQNIQLLETTIETWPGAQWTSQEQLEKIQQTQQAIIRKREKLQQLVKAIEQLEIATVSSPSD